MFDQSARYDACKGLSPDTEKGKLEFVSTKNRCTCRSTEQCKAMKPRLDHNVSCALLFGRTWIFTGLQCCRGNKETRDAPTHLALDPEKSQIGCGKRQSPSLVHMVTSSEISNAFSRWRSKQEHRDLSMMKVS